jgi:hypothetical protein
LARNGLGGAQVDLPEDFLAPGSTSGSPIIRAIAEYLPESDIPDYITMGWFRFSSA